MAETSTVSDDLHRQLNGVKELTTSMTDGKPKERAIAISAHPTISLTALPRKPKALPNRGTKRNLTDLTNYRRDLEKLNTAISKNSMVSRLPTNNTYKYLWIQVDIVTSQHFQLHVRMLNPESSSIIECWISTCFCHCLPTLPTLTNSIYPRNQSKNSSTTSASFWIGHLRRICHFSILANPQKPFRNWIEILRIMTCTS